MLKPSPYQNNLCFIKIILHSRHGVALFWVFKLLHVHLQLAVETTHLEMIIIRAYTPPRLKCVLCEGVNMKSQLNFKKTIPTRLPPVHSAGLI